jgi:hypothetical protein
VLLLCFVALPAKGIHLTNKNTGIFILVLCLVGLPFAFTLVEMRVRAVKRKLSESTSPEAPSTSNESSSNASPLAIENQDSDGK